MVQCPRCGFTHLWICRETCICEPENWGLIAKEVFSLCEIWIISASKLPETTHWSIFLFIKTTTLVKYLSFLEGKGSFSLFTRKSSDSTFSPKQDSNIYGSQYSQNPLPDLFSHRMVELVLGVSLHSFETAGKHIFVNLWIGAWWQ